MHTDLSTINTHTDLSTTINAHRPINNKYAHRPINNIRHKQNTNVISLNHRRVNSASVLVNMQLSMFTVNNAQSQ